MLIPKNRRILVNKWGYILFLLLIVNSYYCTESKNNSQHNLTRPALATQEKKASLLTKLNKIQVDWEGINLFIRAFKKEQLVEIWVKNQRARPYKKLLEYDFCQSSGILGPKRKEGDKQIPEGLYHINRFNPKSNYYLSLGLNYPNESDKIRGDQQAPGSDIFIHGDCVTVGCIAITDNKIKELYILAQQADRNGQSVIPVHFYPAKLTDQNLDQLKKQYPKHLLFWQELKMFYDHFEQNKTLAAFRINSDGRYELK